MKRFRGRDRDSLRGIAGAELLQECSICAFTVASELKGGIVYKTSPE